MPVTREGAHPQEEREFCPGADHYCYSERLVSEVIDFFKLKGDARIIDLAAGVGAMANDFLNKLPNARITGIDPYVPKTPPTMPFQNRLSSAEFHHLNTTAEETGLDNASVDLITCGQGFSLLKFRETRSEARRILKPGCGVALFFIHGADRACSGLEEFIFELPLPEAPTPFMREFWALIKEKFYLPTEQRQELHSNDQRDPSTTAYNEIMRTTNIMHSFFHNCRARIKTVTELWGYYSFTDVYTMCRWSQDEDDIERQDTFRPHAEFMLERERQIQKSLRTMFEKYQIDGKVPFYHYVTVFYGPLTGPVPPLPASTVAQASKVPSA